MTTAAGSAYGGRGTRVRRPPYTILYELEPTLFLPVGLWKTAEKENLQPAVATTMQYDCHFVVKYTKYIHNGTILL